MGKKKEIDEDLVRELASIHCTNEEIASICKCSVDTLVKRCSDIIKEGKSQGKASLRRKQYQMAMKGNPSMLVWLGKQILGQTDYRQHEMHINTEIKPIKAMTIEDLRSTIEKDPFMKKLLVEPPVIEIKK